MGRGGKKQKTVYYFLRACMQALQQTPMIRQARQALKASSGCNQPTYCQDSAAHAEGTAGTGDTEDTASFTYLAHGADVAAFQPGIDTELMVHVQAWQQLDLLPCFIVAAADHTHGLLAV